MLSQLHQQKSTTLITKYGISKIHFGDQNDVIWSIFKFVFLI